METDDDLPPKLTRTAKHQDELNKLGRAWFAEVSAQSEREAEEFANWKRGHRKRAVFDKRSGFGGFASLSGDDASSD